jgi:hypothetical protein
VLCNDCHLWVHSDANQEGEFIDDFESFVRIASKAN